MYPPLPMKLVEVRGDHGVVETGEDRHPVNLQFLEEKHPGDYIIVQMGYGIQLLQESELYKNRNSLTDIRKNIEKELAGTEYTVLITSGIQAANPQFHKARYSFPPDLNFTYGPGCPACMTPAGYYHTLFRLAQEDPVILVAFGHIMNMPTPGGSLQTLRAAGYDIRIVHSPNDVLRIAEWNPSKEVVLAAVGYDVMAATAGATLKDAADRGIENLSFMFSLQKRDALIRDYIIKAPRRIEGVVCSVYDIAVAGTDSYRFVTDELKLACSCAGFIIEDIMQGVLHVIRQSKNKNFAVQDSDGCRCSGPGNPRIQSIINELFTCEYSTWATGEAVADSSYVLREEYRHYDAKIKFNIQHDESLLMPGCHGREVQLGLKIPSECPQFASACTPDNPVGAGMISEEGLCHSWYYSSIKVKTVSQ